MAWADEALKIVACLKQYAALSLDPPIIGLCTEDSRVPTRRSDASPGYAPKFANVSLKVFSARNKLLHQYTLKLDLAAFARAGVDRCGERVLFTDSCVNLPCARLV